MVAQPLYDRVIFQPLRYPKGTYDKLTVDGTKPTEVYFSSASENKLHGLMYQSNQSDKVVLVSHGNSGNISHHGYQVGILLKDGVSVFVYDYAGYGRSEGTTSLGSLQQDALGAYKYLTVTKHFSRDKIVLFGESIGTLVTGRLAQSVDCNSIVLELPLYSMRRICCEHFSFDLHAAILQPKKYIRIQGVGHGDAAMLQSKDYVEGLREFLKSN